MPANLENSAVATGLQKVSFHSNPKEKQCQLKCSESPWAFFLLYAKWASHLHGLLVKNPSEIQETNCHAGDPGSIPGLRRSPGEGNGNPLQYSCMENLMYRGAWWATVHGVTRVVHDLATKPPTTIGKMPPGCP